MEVHITPVSRSPLRMPSTLPETFGLQIGGSGTVRKISSSGGNVSGSPYINNLNDLPDSIAIDGSNTAWLVDDGNSVVYHLSNAGAFLSPSGGFTGVTGYSSGSYISPASLALDSSGDVWFANDSLNTLTEFIGASTPVTTPLALAAKKQCSRNEAVSPMPVLPCDLIRLILRRLGSMTPSFARCLGQLGVFCLALTSASVCCAAQSTSDNPTFRANPTHAPSRLLHSFSREGWLNDYELLKSTLERGYSNLAWFASPEGGVNLPALNRRTLEGLRQSTSDAEARTILLNFVTAFHDGHFSENP